MSDVCPICESSTEKNAQICTICGYNLEEDFWASRKKKVLLRASAKAQWRQRLSQLNPSGTKDEKRMNQLLKLHTTVQTTSAKPCTVEAFLGGGGQGEVYRATLDGKPLALKWYFPKQATPEQQHNLETLIRKGPPSAHFLWPMEMMTADRPGFGYLMPLREPRY